MKDLVRAQRCLRRLVIAYNIFFWVTGPGIVGLGAWVYVALDEYEPVVQRRDFQGPAYLIIVAGATSVVAGVVGCLGSINEHKRLLKLYFLLMFAVCCLEISATVYSFLLYDDMESTIKSSMEVSVSKYREADGDAIDGIDYTQRQLSCCGIDKVSDWLLPLAEGGNVTVVPTAVLPISCCPSQPLPQMCTVARAFLEGCLPDLLSWAQKISKISGWITFAMASTQLLALAVVCCLTDTISFIHFW